MRRVGQTTCLLHQSRYVNFNTAHFVSRSVKEQQQQISLIDEKKTLIANFQIKPPLKLYSCAQQN